MTTKHVYPYEVREEGGRKVVTQRGIPIRYLPEPYKLVKPLLVTREDWYDDKTGRHTIWSHPPTEAWAEGSVANLKQEIVALYEDLAKAPDKELGKLPLAWKQFLLEHIAVERIDENDKAALPE